MVTLKEIAQAVGVSTTTVSRVLNYDTSLSISDHKRQAIIETAEALEYSTPRNRARAALQDHSGPAHGPDAGAEPLKIALVHFLGPTEELADPYYVGVRLGIESHCQKLKAEVVKVYHTDNLPDASVLQSATGVIAVGKHTDAEIGWLRQHSRTLVFADVCPTTDMFDCVESDLHKAMRLLLDDLYRAGYRRIAYIGARNSVDNIDYPLGEMRNSAFMAWTQEKGLFRSEWLATDELCFENGYGYTRKILAGAELPDILITGNDNVAIGAYRAIREKGLSIPRDIGVASFNDIPAAQFLSPPLTTVKIYSERIGETAVDLLMEQISGRDYNKRVYISTDIVWRESCRTPR